MLIVIFLFLTIIFSSGLCSMAEAAVLSLPMIRARILHENKRKNSKDLLYIKENITQVITSIVIVNNVINIVGSIFVGQKVIARFGSQWLGVASAVVTFSIIVASEIIPKTIGERHKIFLSLAFARPLRILTWVFRPFVALLMNMIKVFMKDPKLPKVTEDEIKMMLKLGRAEGTVEMDEEVLCGRVFKLNDVRAAQIMKPIEQIYALQANKTLAEVKAAVINSRFSRIAVYDKDPLDIVGVVEHRVLLREMAKDNYETTVRDFMMDALFVNWFMKADALLEKFQACHQHLFIVQDAEKKKVGLVTMEDVLEELFGEIYDEKDVIKPEVIS